MPIHSSLIEQRARAIFESEGRDGLLWLPVAQPRSVGGTPGIAISEKERNLYRETATAQLKAELSSDA